jgi:hypothetical protein
MSRLVKLNQGRTPREQGAGGRKLRELSDRDLDRVAGAGCIFNLPGEGPVVHASYPKHA